MKIGKLKIRPTRRGWMIFALATLFLSSYAADAVASIGSVRSGVQVGSLELGGMSEDDARAALTERAEELVSQPVELFADTNNITVTPSEIGFQPDVEATLDDAMGVGRRGNLLVRFWHRIRSMVASTDVGWTSDYDAEAAEILMTDFASRIDTEGHEAGIEARGTEIVAVGAVPGRRLNHEGSVEAMIEGLETWPRRSIELPISVEERRTTLDDAQRAAEQANRWIRAPIVLVAPDDSERELSREELASMLEAVPEEDDGDWRLQVRFSAERVDGAVGESMQAFEQEAADASWAVSGSVAELQAGQDGRSFDPEGTASALGDAAQPDEGRRADVAFAAVEPDLGTEEARDLNIHELVSTFTTNHPCCQPRVSNIHKMADTVNGALIRPGASFSLNNHVGQRTTEKGYVLAPMIFDGEFRDDVGGGVSQFATTFFNAIFFGGYRFDTYKAHSYYISRYPEGREATISWPRPDLAFTNDSSSGILVRTNYSDTSITVSFYGDKEGKSVTAEKGERTNFTEFEEQRKFNPDMAPGSERVAQQGAQGFDITVTRIITIDGDSKRERIFTRYRAQPKIVEHGPEVEATPTPSPEEPGTPGEPRQTPTPAPPDLPGGAPAG